MMMGATRVLIVSMCLVSEVLQQASGFLDIGWCPYKTMRTVPCKVKNGTEAYLGPDLCWKGYNGSAVCTKRVLQRPTYATVYKHVPEISYRCCPGLEGTNCQNECFNCTTVRRLEDRMKQIEEILYKFMKEVELLQESPKEGSNELENSIPEEVDPEVTSDSQLAKPHEYEIRFAQLESQLSKLSATLDAVATTVSAKKGNRIELRNHKVKSPNHAPLVRHYSEAETTTWRNVEDNLERGDIASTINEDYEDTPNTNSLALSSKEEYADLLRVGA